MNYDYVFKILVIGDSNAGKTSIVQRYCYDSFSNSTKHTLGMDIHFKVIQKDNKKIKLEIWDASGNEKYFDLTERYFSECHGVLLLFDVTKGQKEQHIDFWLTQVKNSIPVIIVGNKIDLDCDINSYRFVHSYYPISVKDRTNIEFVFDELINRMIDGLNFKSSLEIDSPPPKQRRCACS